MNIHEFYINFDEPRFVDLRKRIAETRYSPSVHLSKDGNMVNLLILFARSWNSSWKFPNLSPSH